MNLSLGFTPIDVFNWIGNLFVKGGHWLLVHWLVFAKIAGVIIAIIVVYSLLFKHLSNYYKFKNEKSVQREKRTV